MIMAKMRYEYLGIIHRNDLNILFKKGYIVLCTIHVKTISGNDSVPEEYIRETSVKMPRPVRHAAFCVVWDELPPMPVLMLPEEPEPLPPQAVSVSAAASVQPKTVQDIFFVIIETLPFLPHRKGAFGLVCPESSGFISRLPRSVVSFTLKGSAAAARCPAQCPTDRYGSPIPVPPGI